jgi:adenosine kinase
MAQSSFTSRATSLHTASSLPSRSPRKHPKQERWIPVYLPAARAPCSYSSQVFTLNLSAPFIPQFFKVQLEQIFPYCDFVIGNESEAAAWASAVGLPNKVDIPAIAKSIATLPKSNPSRSRTVIITQGPDSTVVVTATEPDKPKIFSVTRLEDGQIVDTNGAGDAFAGGFLGALVAGKSVDEAVLAGHKLGGMCVQLVSTPETSCASVS